MYGAITGEFERGASLLWVLLAANVPPLTCWLRFHLLHCAATTTAALVVGLPAYMPLLYQLLGFVKTVHVFAYVHVVEGCTVL